MTGRRCRLARVHRRMLAVPAQEAGTVGYLPRWAVEASLPYRPVPRPLFRRRAGRLHLTLLAPPGLDLPYGRYPRLFLVWLCSRAVRCGRRRVPVDGTLSHCLRELGLGVTGGARGTLHPFRWQARRLLAARISVRWDGGTGDAGRGRGAVHAATPSFRLLRAGPPWVGAPWGEEAPDGERGTRLELSRRFFAALADHPVPLDLRAYRALRSALAQDVYAWLSYRLFGLRRPLVVAWDGLYEQFGSQCKRRRDFRRELCAVLPDVLTVYPAARVRRADDGLLLLPSPPSVRPRR